MAPALEEDLRTWVGIVSRVSGVVGSGASYALFHFGAFEEGKRVGTECGAGALDKTLARLDALLSQRTDVLRDEGRRVLLAVSPTAAVDVGEPALKGILAGFVEGALTATRGARYRGTVVEPDEPSGGRILMEFREESA